MASSNNKRLHHTFIPGIPSFVHLRFIRIVHKWANSSIMRLRIDATGQMLLDNRSRERPWDEFNKQLAVIDITHSQGVNQSMASVRRPNVPPPMLSTKRQRSDENSTRPHPKMTTARGLCLRAGNAVISQWSMIRHVEELYRFQ